jgi:hypothetical protein
VAKTRRFGLGERVGWLRRNDVDSEMWPEESFGGVSDEQFWDDLSADKPLASTARTAQPADGESRPRPEPRSARPGQSRLGPLPGSAQPPALAERPSAPSSDRTAAQPVLPAATHAQGSHAQGAPAAQAQAATQAFPVAGQQAAGPRTGPQPAYTGPQPAYRDTQSAYTGPLPAYRDTQSAYTGPQPAYRDPQSAYSGPQPAYRDTQSAYTGPQPAYRDPQTGPLPVRSAAPRPAASQPQTYPQPQPLPQLPPAQAGPPAQSLPPTQGMPAMKSVPGAGGLPVSRGRHSGGGDDPLTSDKFSLRAAPDGRSYQASRRSRDLTREQYDAALAQETQTFSMADGDTGSGAYPVQPLPSNGTGPRRRHGDSGEHSYGADSNSTGGHPYPYSQQPGNQTPPRNDSYSGDSSDFSARGTRAGEPRRGPAPRDTAPRDTAPRDTAAREGFGRPARPVYPDRRAPYDPRGGERR